MLATPIDTTAHLESTQTTCSPFQAQVLGDAVLKYCVERGVLQPEGRAIDYVRAILAVPPEELRVRQIARRVYASRRTLARHLRLEGLPAPIDWVALARAVYAHRAIVRGWPLRRAAAAAGYPDQFTMSNAIHRITGIRPSHLRNVSLDRLLDVWIAHQRERGALAGPPAPAPAACPLCGEWRAS